jgi:hypothetical protein
LSTCTLFTCLQTLAVGSPFLVLEGLGIQEAVGIQREVHLDHQILVEGRRSQEVDHQAAVLLVLLFLRSLEERLLGIHLAGIRNLPEAEGHQYQLLGHPNQLAIPVPLVLIFLLQPVERLGHHRAQTGRDVRMGRMEEGLRRCN